MLNRVQVIGLERCRVILVCELWITLLGFKSKLFHLTVQVAKSLHGDNDGKNNNTYKVWGQSSEIVHYVFSPCFTQAGYWDKRLGRKKKWVEKNRGIFCWLAHINSPQLSAWQRLSPLCLWLDYRMNVWIVPILCLICCMSLLVIRTTLAPCSLGGVRCSKAYCDRNWHADNLLFVTFGRRLNTEENGIVNWSRESTWTQF